MAWFDGVMKFGSELKRLNDELITTRVEFKALKERSVESIEQFKALIEKSADRINRIEIEHIRERAELNAKIESLSERLNMLSERALHAVMKDAAMNTVARKVQSGEMKSDERTKAIEGPDGR